MADNFLNTSKIFLLLCYLFSPSLAAVQDDDFWLLLEPIAESSFSISSFKDSDAQLSLNLQLDQKINDDIHLNLAWSRFNLDENIQSSSLGFSSNPYNDNLWFYSFNRWGEAGLINSRDHEFRWQYFRNQWNVLLGLQAGDLEITFVRRLRNGQTAVNSNHQAVIIGFGYSHKNFYWQVENIQHQYQKDLSQLASNRFLLNIIEPSALQQSSTLNKNVSQFTFGFNIKTYTVSAQLSRIKSVLNTDVSDFISTSLTWSMTTNYQLGWHFIQPLQTGSQSIGLSLTTQW